MVGLDNVGANPDLGNIYWHYEHARGDLRGGDRRAGAALDVLALQEPAPAPHPGARTSRWFIRVPLDDGDIDYRFAISAMVDAGYEGYLAVEGANLGDQLTHDKRSADYVRGILKDLGQ